jgi:hypothetical protein
LRGAGGRGPRRAGGACPCAPTARACGGRAAPYSCAGPAGAAPCRQVGLAPALPYQQPSLPGRYLDPPLAARPRPHPPQPTPLRRHPPPHPTNPTPVPQPQPQPQADAYRVVADVPGVTKADLNIRLVAATPKQPATLVIAVATPKDGAGAADGGEAAAAPKPEALLRERRRAGAAAERRVPLPDDGALAGRRAQGAAERPPPLAGPTPVPAPAHALPHLPPSTSTPNPHSRRHRHLGARARGRADRDRAACSAAAGATGEQHPHPLSRWRARAPRAVSRRWRHGCGWRPPCCLTCSAQSIPHASACPVPSKRTLSPLMLRRRSERSPVDTTLPALPPAGAHGTPHHPMLTHVHSPPVLTPRGCYPGPWRGSCCDTQAPPARPPPPPPPPPRLCKSQCWGRGLPARQARAAAGPAVGRAGRGAPVRLRSGFRRLAPGPAAATGGAGRGPRRRAVRIAGGELWHPRAGGPGRGAGRPRFFCESAAAPIVEAGLGPARSDRLRLHLQEQ